MLSNLANHSKRSKEATTFANFAIFILEEVLIKIVGLHTISVISVYLLAVGGIGKKEKRSAFKQKMHKKALLLSKKG